MILLFQPTDSADSTSLLWHANSKSFIHCLTWIWNLCVPDFLIKLHVTMLVDFLFEFSKMYNYLLAVLFWNTLWPGKYILFPNLSVLVWHQFNVFCCILLTVFSGHSVRGLWHACLQLSVCHNTEFHLIRNKWKHWTRTGSLQPQFLIIASEPICKNAPLQLFWWNCIQM